MHRLCRTFLAVLAVSFVSAFGCLPLGAVPAVKEKAVAVTDPEQAAIEKKEICVGSAVMSAGDLTDVLYYRATATAAHQISVGYFAFFSEERPWGNNWQTWTLLPALAIDFIYTRALFVGPGLQRAISGKGDVEGFRIDYAVKEDGTLEVVRAEADDGTHRPVHLAAADVFSLDAERPTLYSDVWSHQLGGRGLHSKDELAYVKCYGPSQLRPLPESLEAEFALEGRALPAHVELLGGRAIAREHSSLERPASL